MKLIHILKKNNNYIAPFFEQIVYSSISFLYIFFLAFVGSAEDVAVYASVFSVVVFFQGVQRNAVILPLVLARAGSGDEKRISRAIGLQICLSIMSALVSSLIWFFSDAEYMSIAAQIAVLLSLGLGAYEYARRSLINRGLYLQLLLVLFLYLLFLMIFILLCYFFDFLPYIYILPVAIFSMALVLFANVRLKFNFRQMVQYYKAIAENYKLVLSGLIYGFYNNFLIMLSPIFFMPDAVAAFAIVRNLYQPAQVLVSAIDSFDKKEAVKLYVAGEIELLIKRLFFIYASTVIFVAIYSSLIFLMIYTFPAFEIFVFKGDQVSNLILYFFIFQIVFLFGYQVENMLYILRLDNVLLMSRVYAGVLAVILFSILYRDLGIQSIVLSMILSWLLIVLIGGRRVHAVLKGK